MSPISDTYSDLTALRLGSNLFSSSGIVLGSGGVTLPTGGIVQGDTQNFVRLASGDGAIAVQPGVVMITKGTAAALTLAAPTAGTHDGYWLLIYSTTAAAHTVTNSSPGFNGGGAASDVGTFAAAIANHLLLVAYNGNWYVVNNVGVTLA